MEEGHVTVDGIDPRRAAAVHGDRHPEPHRAGRHLPAARGPARPVPDEDLRRLPRRRRRPRSCSSDSTVRDRAALVEPVITTARSSELSRVAGEVYVDRAVDPLRPPARRGLPRTSSTSGSGSVRARLPRADPGRQDVGRVRRPHHRGARATSSPWPPPVLCHRLLLDAQAAFDGVSVDDVIEDAARRRAGPRPTAAERASPCCARARRSCGSPDAPPDAPRAAARRRATWSPDCAVLAELGLVAVAWLGVLLLLAGCRSCWYPPAADARPAAPLDPHRCAGETARARSGHQPGRARPAPPVVRLPVGDREAGHRCRPLAAAPGRARRRPSTSRRTPRRPAVGPARRDPLRPAGAVRAGHRLEPRPASCSSGRGWWRWPGARPGLSGPRRRPQRPGVDERPGVPRAAGVRPR